MGRNKATVRKRGGHSEDAMKKALDLIKSGMSIRQASAECKLKYPTVRLYVSRTTKNPDARLTPNYEVNKIFTSEQENELYLYIEYCAQLFYGLTTKDCRRVAYQMARVNNIKIPQSWEDSEMAGFEWLRSFRKRHPQISLRKPEACSLARATAFNKHSIATFFSNLKSVMERHPSFADGTRIYNLDETSTTTVQRPGKVLAPKGTNVAKVTSGERGTLVTTCCIVSATGQALPPVMVFPRKKFLPHMTKGAPSGTLGLAAASGWMNAELFVNVMKHFIKHVSASKENPALLIMDNHESHLSIEALDLAKSSGVTILTLHPHTTAKLQPLDVGLNGPFKTYYNAAVDSWLLRNPGQPLTIHNVAECVGHAYMKSMTPRNIVNAFKKTGIFPFDDCIFTEDDFMPSSVTDRPHVVQDNNDQQENSPTSPSLLHDVDLERVSPTNPPPIQDPDFPSLPVLDDIDLQPHLNPDNEDDYPKSLTPLRATPRLIQAAGSSKHSYEPHLNPNNEDDFPRSLTTSLVTPRLIEAAGPSKHSSEPHLNPDIVDDFPKSLTPPLAALHLIEAVGPSKHPSKPHLNPDNEDDFPRNLTPPLATPRLIEAAGPSKFVSPKEFMPPIKAKPRDPKRHRALGRSMIVTDTPEKEAIAAKKKKNQKRDCKSKARPVRG